MALDSIWQQQLTLVCYGNEFLADKLPIEQFKQHPIFNQHLLQFRDLMSQHLLAQHFQVWLEQLKQQGVTRLSLHHTQLLNNEKNPNPNVELLRYPHFIISHAPKQNIAWMCGNERAEWYNADDDYEFPNKQKIDLRLETLWHFELNAVLMKKIQVDLNAPDWEEIDDYLTAQIFSSPYAASLAPIQNVEFIGDQTDTNTAAALLPMQYHAQLANDLLYQLDELQKQLSQQHHLNKDSEAAHSTKQEQDFSEKVDNLFSKLIVKVANHYQSAQRKVVLSPLAAEEITTDNVLPFKSKPKAAEQQHVSSKHVVGLIFMIFIICIAAYYFGF
ncbi:hypothetical protein [Acinetobacter sp. MD2]|uniref:hypothetical protein n=1 Tax=Acinetobacter sp. MD2 TaxID=2600066 RepID=UPI002D1ED8D4|nr:hypothetical protein [Acinetobacter sp. MD2]MEB3767458.1 hypothetical protein [Acinetobacter sp. MD2]